MKNSKESTLGRICLGVVIVLAGWIVVSPTRAVGQTAGNNAVYNSSGNCNSTSHCAGSAAFIDASVFTSNATTLCGVLNYVLVNIVQVTYPYGAVVDARGLNTVNTNMTCPTSQPSPWYGITGTIPPSTILLPAGTIYIPSAWFLPKNTHLIGEGDGVPSGSNTTVNTTIEAVNTFSTSPGNMIQFGSSTLCSSACSGISVEN